MAATFAGDLYVEFFTKLDQNTKVFFTSKAAAIGAYLQGPVHAMLFIYVISYGVLLAQGKIEASISDALTRLLRIAIIVNLSLGAATYSYYIADFFYKVPDEIAGALIGSGTGQTRTDSIGALDQSLNTGIDLGYIYLNAPTGPFDFLTALSDTLFGFFIWIATFVVTGFAALLIAISKIALAVMLGIGPIFIIFLLFKSTQRFFEAWLAQVVTYGMINIVVVAFVVLVLGIFQDAANDAKIGNNGSDLGIAISAIIVAGLGAFVMRQAPQLASGLGGGVTLAATDLIGRAAGLGGRAAGRASGITGFNERRQALRQATLRQGAQATLGRQNARREANSQRVQNGATTAGRFVGSAARSAANTASALKTSAVQRAAAAQRYVRPK